MALISYWLFVVAFPQLIGLVGCAVPTHLKAELLRTLAALARYFQLLTTMNTCQYMLFSCERSYAPQWVTIRACIDRVRPYFLYSKGYVS